MADPELASQHFQGPSAFPQSKKVGYCEASAGRSLSSEGQMNKNNVLQCTKHAHVETSFVLPRLNKVEELAETAETADLPLHHGLRLECRALPFECLNCRVDKLSDNSDNQKAPITA
jgi:hypothetical protein